jgi:hypothetical protein|tara:strand:- start:27417 stop:29348 length:1932 start_codon:yes stop_codon:yes gene_type:complete
MKKFLPCIIILLFNIKGYTQEIVLKPSEDITSWYNLEEWIYSKANWGYNSYDLTNFEPFSPFYVNTLQKSPLLFIDEHNYQTNWLDQDLFYFPNIPLSIIDSVVINTTSKTMNGFLTPNGSISIYLIKKMPLVESEFNLVNQINDPGLLAEEPELQTPNVERINSTIKAGIVYPEIFNTRFLFNDDTYTRANRLVYDRKVDNTLFDRTRITTPDSPGSTFIPQRNTETDFILLNQIKTHSFYLSLLASYNLKDTFFQWHPISGIELASEHKRTFISASIHPQKNGVYKHTNISIGHAASDSLQFSDPIAYGLNETTIQHSTAFLFPIKDAALQVSISNSVFIWNDYVSNKRAFVNDINLISTYSNEKLGDLGFVVGSHSLGFEYTNNPSLGTSFRISTFKRNLESNGYNYTLFNNEIGFSNLDRSKHEVINFSDLSNTQTSIGFDIKTTTKRVHLKLGVFANHFWNFVDTMINYEPVNGEDKLNSSIVFSDIKNSGFFGYKLSAKLNLVNNISLMSALSGHVIRYGSDKFKSSISNINRTIFSQTINYKVHDNALLGISFRYTSSRKIDDFTTSFNQSGTFPPVKVRPIFLLNATAKTWLFDRSLGLTLALRNLLNSTESYNTNGQYYNMSIGITAHLAIRSN